MNDKKPLTNKQFEDIYAFRHVEHHFNPELIGVLIWIGLFILFWVLTGGWDGINGRG